MKMYNDLYSFEVLGALKDGKTVEMVDREEHIVYDCSEMKASALIFAVNHKETERFKFWTVEESESSNEQ